MYHCHQPKKMASILGNEIGYIGTQAKIGTKAGIPRYANYEAGILQEKGSLFISLYSFMFFYVRRYKGTQTKICLFANSTYFLIINKIHKHKTFTYFTRFFYVNHCLMRSTDTEL